jgi:RimJ/RimL family protein N-acetyltransferase
MEVMKMTTQPFAESMVNHPTHGDIPHELAQLEGTFPLHGGGTAHVRAIRADDTERLRAFHRQLSPESITFRFFRYMPELPLEEAERFTHVDYERRMALVATSGSGESEQILGVVCYDHIGPQTAEVAFVVEDHWQGHGIATALLHLLADYARRRGYTTLVAITMGNNARMIEVLHNSGFPCTTHYTTGEVEVHLDISRPVPAT